MPAALVATMLVLSACEAIPALENTPPTDGSRAQAEQFVRLGDSTRDAGDFESAATLYRRAMDSQPNWDEPLLRLGEVALRLNVLSDAELAFRSAAALNNANLSAHLGLGRTLLRLGDHQQALSVFEMVIEQENRDGRSYNGAAIALELLDRHDDAQALYLDGIAADPTRISLYNNRGLSMAVAGNYAKAIEWLNGVLQEGNGNVQTRQTLALVYGLSGDETNAAKIAHMDLGVDDVNNNLQYYARLRQLPDAERTSAIFGLAWSPAQ